MRLQSHSNKGVFIGNDVWIGTNAIILPGTKIEDHAIIAVGSIVTKNILKYAILRESSANKQKSLNIER